MGVGLTAICKAEDFVTDFESTLGLSFAAELFNSAAKLDAEDCACASGDGIFAFALDKIHTV